MTDIKDVSPIGSNTSTPSVNHSVIGRMLSIAGSPDGQTLYMGSYSNLWTSDDRGQNWEQLVWPQPAPDQFDVPGSLGGWCVVDIAVALGWRVDKDPRFLAPLTPRGHMDIVGFGDCGVWTALGNGDGTFQAPSVVLPNQFGYEAGGWQVDKHPRFVVDLNADGCADIVGFGDDGVWTAIGNGDGTFQQPNLVLGNYGYSQDWRVDKHPRFLAHLTNSGFADIVGFGEDGVWVALGNGDGTFREPNPNPVLGNYGYHQDWRVDKHPRLLASLTTSGFADIVGFGADGVWTALSNGDGTFSEPNHNPVLANFSYKQGWRVDKHPRFLADLDGDGCADIVGFGDSGVYTVLSNGDGTFREPFPNPVFPNFGYDQGWRVDRHPRFLADLDNDGCADIVGFYDTGVYTVLSNKLGSFMQPNPNPVLSNFGYEAGGWQVDKHPRFVVDLNGDGCADIVGFGDAGVWTALANFKGGFPTANFVLANFGYDGTVLALTAFDRASGSSGIWRSSDQGATWTQVHQFPAGGFPAQLEWALGSDHLVYAAGVSSLAISKDAGVSFEDVFPWGTGPAKKVNHVAVWQNAPADIAPQVIFALGDGTMFVSFDGGVTWIEDQSTQIPSSVGGVVGIGGNSNTSKVMVISPRWPSEPEIYVVGNGSSDCTTATLCRGNYSEFPFGTQRSIWQQLILPDEIWPCHSSSGVPGQDSGNVFLATTQPGRGDLLFYGGQRPVACVGPLHPAAPSDWQLLDANVHYDLHGFLLSPDFDASIDSGNYWPKAGMAWLLADGGVYRSTDGGQHFELGHNATTLSCVSVAGVANFGDGPALSLNNGDNDGFYSMDGGATWSYQDYGGGDNDCAFADPLRSQSMLVFTPRSEHTVSIYETDPGKLPNAAKGTSDRRARTGPPPLPDSVQPRAICPVGPLALDRWNASSCYGSRGSRPIVLGLLGEDAPAEGDYIFILFGETQAVLVRTQNILDIADSSEWLTTATGPGQGANVYLQGPPLPNLEVGVVQASGGHAATVFYVGGDRGSGLWTWAEGATSWTQLVPGPGATHAFRFFAHPYQPNVIYILDDHVKRSDDGGNTWQVDTNLETQLTWGGQIMISSNDNSSGLQDFFDLVLTDMKFDPTNPTRRFAVGEGGAFSTNDGVNWTRLLHTGALAGRPANCYYDWISMPTEPALYVAFAGRSLVKISPIP